MSNNKMNQGNLKSVTGRGPAPTTQNTVDKAKAIVKEELKKESLTKAAGTGPISATMKQGGRVEGRPAGQLPGGKQELGKDSLGKAAGTGPLPATMAQGGRVEGRPAGQLPSGKQELSKDALSKATGTGPLPATMKQGGRVEGRPAGQLSAKAVGSQIATPPVCITPEQIS